MLRTPRGLIGLILGITVAPLATLLWLGWRLLEQDRLLEGQQLQQRMERAADLVVAALQRALAVSEQRLAAGTEQWPAGAVAVAFRDTRVEVCPRGRVAFLPVAERLREAPAPIFARGEELEFRVRDHAAAAQVFRELAPSNDPAVRAGALLRLARNLHRGGQVPAALAAYWQLSEIDGVAAGGAPAGLVARYGRCKLLAEIQRQPELRAEAQRLQGELTSGRWVLTAPLYWLYVRDAARWTGAPAGSHTQPELFAEALQALWQRRDTLAASGRESLVIEGRNLAVVWQSSNGLLRALMAAPEFVESEWLAAVAPVVKEQRITLALRDPQGKAIFGTAGPDRAPRAARSARDAGLPWGVVATTIDPAAQHGDFVLRRRLLTVGFLLLVSMALTAGYWIVRSVSRELAVARVQSDFVSAVSHEFRTPLTALRQFTDMLRENQTLSDDRRRLCYEAQGRATERLTRLVESLLDFGRMEAGARRYQFERRDCTELVRRVVDDFQGEARTAGYEIEFHGNGAAPIDTDPEALSRAVWNLLDNAVKYSPDPGAIEVDVGRRHESVSIAVRDRGIGIPAHERAVIFGKFHRGEQARSRGIQGTGIGLAMVDQIVRAHHGRVEVESEPGKGSTFTILLPAKD
jgi:signal transduction histidine kinase